MLPFPAVHREFHGFSIRAIKGFVAVQNSLNEVFAWLEIAEMVDGIAESRIVDDRSVRRLQRVDVNAENNLRCRRVVDLHAGLRRRVGGKNQQ